MSYALFLPVATAVLLLSLRPVACGNPRIAHSRYVYSLKDGDEWCVYASFKMSFDIFYENGNRDTQPPYTTIDVPDNRAVNVSGSCVDKTHPELLLEWEDNSVRMDFGIKNGKWELNELTFVFYLSRSLFTNSTYAGLQSFSTNDTDLFQRTFKTSEYFYCSHCKTYKFGNYSSSVCQDSCQSPCVNNTCSAVHMEKSVIYVLKDPSKADKRLCLEDYIALQEIIVPIIVGGVLALLLILIFVAYVIAYVRRRRREAKSQYEPVGDF